MIVASGLTKRYGDTVAVDSMDFVVEPGRVTGFLGPNGAGKSTTMRMILGLDRPTSGSVTVDGQVYGNLPAPLRSVGALLEAKAVHRGRSAYHHLLWLAASNGIDRRRVDEVLELVGLSRVARRRAGGFSLGMGQRLGIAAALLGDPQIVLLDEPVNGLDPEGILWVRTLMKRLAEEGRTVLVSSHLMSEMALTADHLIVVGRGRVLADEPTEDFISRYATTHVRVRSPHARELAELVAQAGWQVEPVLGGDVTELAVHGADAAQIGELAGASGVFLHELTPVGASLEEAFMRLTADSVEYSSRSSAPENPHAGDRAVLTGASA